MPETKEERLLRGLRELRKLIRDGLPLNVLPDVPQPWPSGHGHGVAGVDAQYQRSARIDLLCCDILREVGELP